MIKTASRPDSNIDIVISDLDGTLLPSQSSISEKDRETLHHLKTLDITRVIATGRTLQSALSILQYDFPIDYLIFSSGAGIMDWRTKEIIYSQHLYAKEVAQIATILMDNQIDFMLLDPIPHNHKFWYYQTGKKNPDFSRRLNLLKQYATPIGDKIDIHRNACQFLVIMPNNVELFESIKTLFNDINIIRATSPLDHQSIWMEIFPQNISKGHGCQWLCERLGISPSRSLAVGNDYNDIDLLEWSKHSYVVDNAPKELREKYEVTTSVYEDGFTQAMLMALHSCK